MRLYFAHIFTRIRPYEELVKLRCAAYSTLSVRGAALHLCWVVLRHAHQWSTGDAVRQLPQHVSTQYSYPLVLRNLILCYAFTEYTTSQTLVSSVVQCGGSVGLFLASEEKMFINKLEHKFVSK